MEKRRTIPAFKNTIIKEYVAAESIVEINSVLLETQLANAIFKFGLKQDIPKTRKNMDAIISMPENSLFLLPTKMMFRRRSIKNKASITI
jgi:hypothetical protein